MTARFRNCLRLIEVCLLLFCLITGAYFGSIGLQAKAARKASASFGTPLPEEEHLTSTMASSTQNNIGPATDVIGRLEVPSLHLSVPILADYQAADLLHGVGHVPGTAMPGGLGTMGLAGHRDTYFRPLRGILPKMDIRVSKGLATYHYEVDRTEVVQPEDVQVLDIQARPELTLITCYPFNYIGAAPQRFIVHAHLISALPD